MVWGRWSIGPTLDFGEVSLRFVTVLHSTVGGPEAAGPREVKVTWRRTDPRHSCGRGSSARAGHTRHALICITIPVSIRWSVYHDYLDSGSPCPGPAMCPIIIRSQRDSKPATSSEPIYRPILMLLLVGINLFNLMRTGSCVTHFALHSLILIVYWT